jgi:Rrf2 family protein
MARIITLSEASSIAIHAMVLIAKAEGNLNVNKIAEMTGASRNHLAKVMQRLVKDKYVKSTRGPLGGFVLIKPADEISMLDIYQSIEGEILETPCPLDRPICPFSKCLMGGIMFDLTSQFRDYLTKQKLADYL